MHQLAYNATIGCNTMDRLVVVQCNNWRKNNDLARFCNANTDNDTEHSMNFNLYQGSNIGKDIKGNLICMGMAWTQLHPGMRIHAKAISRDNSITGVEFHRSIRGTLDTSETWYIESV
jgi:hypothetical protein